MSDTESVRVNFLTGSGFVWNPNIERKADTVAPVEVLLQINMTILKRMREGKAYLQNTVIFG